MYTEKMSRMIETQNGTRQPQSLNSSAVSQPLKRQSPITARDRKKPSVAVVWIQLVSYPRLPCGACSATYVAAPPYSPPSASPCTSLNVTSRMGAAQPIASYLGRKPTRHVDPPMKRIVMRKVYLRPTRSPMRPKTIAPKGRTRKPAAYAANAESRAAVWLPGGKNSAAKKGASVAYR